jgi:serine/threonine protein kinase
MNDRSAMSEESLPLSVLLRIDAACQSFEAAWKAARDGGPQPRIEDYLVAAPDAERGPLLQKLLPVELHYRRKMGETVTCEEYQARFSGHDTILQALFPPAPSTTPDLPAQPQNAFSTGPAVPETGPLALGSRTVDGLRFQILRPHARGGLGEVFVAHDGELNRSVALKEIQERYADHPEMRARFLVEAKVTGGLEHPGIVPIYSLGHHADGRPYYAMRFIRGETLKDAIARFHQSPARAFVQGDLEFRQLLSRFVAVCNAVAYAHSRGVIHRDLKPANVMLGKYGETLVVDWGLAKVVGRDAGCVALGPDEASLVPVLYDGSDATQAGAALGTPAFMSPEQAAGRLDLVGPASDVYNLGATLYALLTGLPPVEIQDVAAFLARVQRGDWPVPRKMKPGVPRALDAICRKAMALEPAERYASALELAADVERWLADRPVSAWREPLLRKVWRGLTRPRRPNRVGEFFHIVFVLMGAQVFTAMALLLILVLVMYVTHFLR